MNATRRRGGLACLVLAGAASVLLGTAPSAVAETWSWTGTYLDADYGGHAKAFEACMRDLPGMHTRGRCVDANPTHAGYYRQVLR